MFRSAIFAACVAAASAFAPLSSPLPNAVSGESKPPGVCCGSVAGTCQRVPGEIPMRSWWRSRHNSTLSGSTAQWRSQPSDHPCQPMANLAEVMCLDSSEHGSDSTLCTSCVSSGLRSCLTLSPSQAASLPPAAPACSSLVRARFMARVWSLSRPSAALTRRCSTVGLRLLNHR